MARFKILVTGDRKWADERVMYRALTTYPKDTMVIHGDALGADQMAGELAWSLGMPIAIVPANWADYGRAAGPIRNRWMLDLEPDIVLAFHNDIENSKGTKDCMAEAKKRGIPVTLFTSDAP